MKNKENRALKSQISRKIVMQYFLAVVGFVVGFVFLVFGAWMYCSQFVWQETDPVYKVLQLVKEWIIVFAGVPMLFGIIAITYYFMSKPLRYLDDIVVASGQLIMSKEKPIELSEEMKNIQDELNLFREDALKNEQMAKDAIQRKNDLIVYLAHDLKTPLTSVIGYLSLLQDEPDISAATRAKYTGIALEKAERLEDLINEFFDITRFNLTTLTMDPEETNLTRMLEQIAFEFQPILSEKNLTIHTTLAPNVSIVCDRDKMGRVFDNLLRNAVNYSYSDSEIELQLEKAENTIRILVKNHSKTIPKEKLSRIFEQFFRLDSSRASATGGAGLGLAIAKEIVELHGGQITASSENETTAFEVILPDGLS